MILEIQILPLDRQINVDGVKLVNGITTLMEHFIGLDFYGKGYGKENTVLVLKTHFFPEVSEQQFKSNLYQMTKQGAH